MWTSAEVRQRALGDPDAVSFGDYHLANWVGWALVGHDITDEEMAELLEPYRPHRGRAAAMAMAGGRTAAAARPADERPHPPAHALSRPHIVSGVSIPSRWSPCVSASRVRPVSASREASTGGSAVRIGHCS